MRRTRAILISDSESDEDLDSPPIQQRRPIDPATKQRRMIVQSSSSDDSQDDQSQQQRQSHQSNDSNHHPQQSHPQQQIKSSKSNSLADTTAIALQQRLAQVLKNAKQQQQQQQQQHLHKAKTIFVDTQQSNATTTTSQQLKSVQMPLRASPQTLNSNDTGNDMNALANQLTQLTLKATKHKASKIDSMHHESERQTAATSENQKSITSQQQQQQQSPEQLNAAQQRQRKHQYNALIRHAKQHESQWQQDDNVTTTTKNAKTTTKNTSPIDCDALHNALLCYEEARVLQICSTDALEKKCVTLRRKWRKQLQHLTRLQHQSLNQSSDDDEDDEKHESEEVVFESHNHEFVYNPKTQRYHVQHQFVDNDGNSSSHNNNNNSELPELSLISSFSIARDSFLALYPYQRECLHWLYSLRAQRSGAILADDMGLGKTIQISSFIAALFTCQLARLCLIICPVSVLPHWQRELAKWASDVRCFTLHGTMNKTKYSQYNTCLRHGGVVLTSYGMVVHHLSELRERQQKQNGSVHEIRFDYVFCDEGHRLKNSETQLHASVSALHVRHRFLLTGTPLQNNLLEIYSLMQFCTQNQLFGTERTKAEWARAVQTPIIQGMDRNATIEEQAESRRLNTELKAKIAPYWLRREKSDVMIQKEQHDNALIMQQQHRESTTSLTHSIDSGAAGDAAATVVAPAATSLSIQKNDICLWLYLTERQFAVYCAFISTPEVKAQLNATRSPLAALTVLKKLCDHPRLLTQVDATTKRARAKNGGAAAAAADTQRGGGGAGKMTESLHLNELLPDLDATCCTESEHVRQLITECHKLRMLLALLQRQKQQHREAVHDALSRGDKTMPLPHRTLIFSQSKRMLDMIARCLREYEITYSRIDGSVINPQERQSLVDRFNANNNSDCTIDCMLLTTSAGGVGLNLIGASRVVLYDLGWNPAVDAQAVDRAYRIGQTRNVIVYRFVTCGTLEETIVRKQIFKMSIAHSTLHRSQQQQQQQQNQSQNADLDDETQEDSSSQLITNRKSTVVAATTFSKSNNTNTSSTARYFTRDELRQVFHVPEHRSSMTQLQLQSLHCAAGRHSYPELDHELEWLHSVELKDVLFGISDFDLLFTDSGATAAQELLLSQRSASASTSSSSQYGNSILHHSNAAAASEDEDLSPLIQNPCSDRFSSHSFDERPPPVRSGRDDVQQFKDEEVAQNDDAEQEEQNNNNDDATATEENSSVVVHQQHSPSSQQQQQQQQDDSLHHDEMPPLEPADSPKSDGSTNPNAQESLAHDNSPLAPSHDRFSQSSEHRALDLRSARSESSPSSESSASSEASSRSSHSSPAPILSLPRHDERSGLASPLLNSSAKSCDSLAPIATPPGAEAMSRDTAQGDNAALASDSSFSQDSQTTDYHSADDLLSPLPASNLVEHHQSSRAELRSTSKRESRAETPHSSSVVDAKAPDCQLTAQQIEQYNQLVRADTQEDHETSMSKEASVAPIQRTKSLQQMTRLLRAAQITSEDAQLQLAIVQLAHSLHWHDEPEGHKHAGQFI